MFPCVCQKNSFEKAVAATRSEYQPKVPKPKIKNTNPRIYWQVVDMICVAHGPDYESNTSCAVEDTSRFHSSQFGFKGLVFIGFVECCLAGSPGILAQVGILGILPELSK